LGEGNSNPTDTIIVVPFVASENLQKPGIQLMPGKTLVSRPLKSE